MDAERTEAQERVGDLTSQKSSLQAGKRKAEQQLSTLQEEYEEMETESRDNAEKLRKAMEQARSLQHPRCSCYIRDDSVLFASPPSSIRMPVSSLTTWLRKTNCPVPRRARLVNLRLLTYVNLCVCKQYTP